MKKKLLICLFALLPFIASAQDEAPPLVKDFYEGTHTIPESLVFSDHVNIMQFSPDNENCDIIAVNENMQSMWRTSLKGHALSISKFKDKVLVVVATEFSNTKKTNNTYKGYLLDPANGKVLIDKVIFDGPQEYMAFPYVYTSEDGQVFKFAVRQSGFERRLHVAAPSVFGLISMKSYTKQFHQTKGLDVIDFNEKLEPITKIKPVTTEGFFLGLTSNNKGDLFMNWYENGNMNMVKYDAGKDKPSNKISASIMLDDDLLDNFDNDIPIIASKTNSNVLYYSLVFKNGNKDMELGIGKIDFSTGKKQYVNELLTKDNIKALKKNYVPVNKKMDSPDLGPIKALSVRAFKEIGDRLIISLTSTSSSASTISSGTWESEFNILINGYDTDLNLKYQQIIPTSYTVPERHLPLGFYHDKNKLYIISNDKTGMTTLNGTYSVIDLATGQCDKMYHLSKKKISNSHAAAGSSVLWFKNSFVVPYLELKGFSGRKYDITLQQNSY
ncbi:MAG TPA: hypothetical protein VK668_08190 [Mucilaginibacter sp.]|nr:hypothetical protein [Mucilaginibacter sp.]